MFDYDVFSEEEALSRRFNLLEDGVYDAVITNTLVRQSSSGNPMLELHLDVYAKNGKKHTLKDYLVFIPSMAWKIRHAAASAGILGLYESKKLDEHSFNNKNVQVSVKTQKGALIPFNKLYDKEQGATYPSKNVIDDYIVKSQNIDKNDDFISDDLPF